MATRRQSRFVANLLSRRGRHAGVAMKSERDLIAEWAGEELYSAVRAPQEARSIHMARSEFYLAILRSGVDGAAWATKAEAPEGSPRYY